MTVTEWIKEPLALTDNLVKEGKTPEQIASHFDALIREELGGYEQVPSFNAAYGDGKAKSGSLVRFRCMIQDNGFTPEYFVKTLVARHRVTKEEVNVSLMYKDETDVDEDDYDFLPLDNGGVSMNPTLLCEKQRFFCVDVPAETEWFRSVSGNKSTRTSENVDNRNMDEHLCKIPIRDGLGNAAAIVKVYTPDVEFKMNKIVEFVGVLDASENESENVSGDESEQLFPHVPRLHAILFRTEDELSYPILDDNAADVEYENVRKETIKYMTDALYGDELAAKHLYCHLISRIRVGDIAFDTNTLRLNLYGFTETQETSSDSSTPKKPTTAVVTKLLSLLLPRVHYIPLDLKHLDSRRMAPFMTQLGRIPPQKQQEEKAETDKIAGKEEEGMEEEVELVLDEELEAEEGADAEKEKEENGGNVGVFGVADFFAPSYLASGELQLSDGTWIVLDETKMREGKLGGTGIMNIEILKRLVAFGEVPYNLEQEQVLTMRSSVGTLVLSSGKCMFPIACALPILPSPSKSTKTEDLPPISSDLLDSIRRHLFSISDIAPKSESSSSGSSESSTSSKRERRQNEYTIEKEMADRIKDEFAGGMLGAGAGQERLARVLELSRAIALSRGLTKLDAASWEEAKAMEVDRVKRVEAYK
ncbi:hypothetical protein HK102_005045, partial [Quaeritorhiza haematococci]